MSGAPDFREQFEALRTMAERRLGEVTPKMLDHEPSRVRESMRYSLRDGGKRIRPLLTLLTTKALGGDPADAVDVACAIEMVHTASIIVDDLPCMDDAAMRRGHASNHRQFGEDIAILGSVALISTGFELIAASGLDDATRVALTGSLARAIGVDGLCGGQERDLRESATDVESLEKLQFEKTGALFVFCLEAGARVAGVSDEAVEPFRCFGRHAGLGFQMLDDLLDVVGTEASTGKDHGNDVREILDADAMQKKAMAHLDTAVEAIRSAGFDPAPFQAFLNFVVAAFNSQAVSRQESPTPGR